MEAVEAEGDGEQVTLRLSSSPPSRDQGAPAVGARVFDCRQKVRAVLCSHIGVAIVLGAYSVMGGFLFQAIELPAEMEARSHVARLREEHVDRIWKLGLTVWKDSGGMEVGTPEYGKTNFTDGLRDLLRKYLSQAEIQTNRYDAGFEPDDARCWSFVGAILYSVTIITTVGYGHVTPRTSWGRFLTIVYGLIGIPLMMVYLFKMGSLFAEGFRLFYQRVCCDLFCCKRCERARRRRRSQLLYQSRNDALVAAAASYPYRVGYSRRIRPGSELVESAVDAGSDVTQGLLTQNENLAYLRDNEPATCVNMAFHGSLPRSASKANRDWKTQSSHVYETISLIDDMNPGQPVTKTKPRTWSARPESRTSSGHHSKTTWSPERTLSATDKALGLGERGGDRTFEKRPALDSRATLDRDRTLERKVSVDSKMAYLRTQRQFSQATKLDRKPSSRLSAVERQYHSLPRNKKLAESRTENKITTPAEKPKRQMSVRRATTASAPSPQLLTRTKTVSATFLDGRRQKRASAVPVMKGSGRNARHKADRKRGETQKGTTGPEEVSPTGNGLKALQFGQSDESFVTAPDDSSSDMAASTDTGSGENDAETVVRRKMSQEAATKSRQKKKKTGVEKIRKRDLERVEKDGGTTSGLPLASVSIEDGEPSKQHADGKVYAACSKRKVPVPIGACLMVMVTYIFAGSLGFCLLENWDYTTGPYFCFVSLSTIGFGDFVPGAGAHSSASTEKFVVCAIWLMLGLTLLSMCIILTSEHFVRRPSMRSSRNQCRLQ